MKSKKDRLIAYLFIIIPSIIVSIPLFKFNIQYDDGIQHVVRLIETARELKVGSMFPVIMQNLCNGFGYSWNLFYSPLTAYLPLIFRIFSISYENCLKLFMFVISILSGFANYYFLLKILKKRDIEDSRKNLIASLGAAFYILASYRLNDMYIRVAVAELASFIFLPIIFNGLYSIINLKEKNYILCFGIVGLILSHTLIAFYTAIFCIIYLIVNIKEIKKNEFLILFKNILFAMLITCFYWMPLLESRFSANYEVFNQSHMVREDFIRDFKVNVLELLYMKKGGMAFFIGLPISVGLVFTIIMINKKKIKDKKNYYFFLISGVISLFLTLDFIPFENFPSFMRMMQFSFRLLEFSTFFLITIASINLGLSFKEGKILIPIVSALIMIISVIPIFQNINYDESYIDESRLMEGIAVTENTGRVHAGCATFEYLPTKAFNNLKYIASREDIAISFDDNVEITNFEKDRLKCSFNAKGEGIIELPYIYYIGYNAKMDGKNLKITESENGFCQINIDSEDFKEIKVSYTGSTIMKISLIITILSLLISIIYFVKLKVKKFND